MVKTLVRNSTARQAIQSVRDSLPFNRKKYYATKYLLCCFSENYETIDHIDSKPDYSIYLNLKPSPAKSAEQSEIDTIGS